VLRHDGPVVRRALPLALLLALLLAALTGCGSRPVAEYPPPPGLPRSPPELRDLPGEVTRVLGFLGLSSNEVDRRRSTLTLDGRTVRTPLEPVGLALTRDRAYVVGGRERALAAYARPALRELERVPAGVGPTNLLAGERLVYVADTTGRSLLVFRTEPELALVHRTALPGAPWALAADRGRDRVWVTIPGRNRLLAFSATSRPERLQGFGTVARPAQVAVLADGDVLVTGADAKQRIDPDRD
jgi:hypothetical protein